MRRPSPLGGGRRCPRSGQQFARADCLGNLALLEALRGRLGRAAKLAGEAAGAAESSIGLADPVGPAANVALAWVYLERNEPRQARGQLRLADDALRIAPDRLKYAIAWHVAARCGLADGRTRMAAEMVQPRTTGLVAPALARAQADARRVAGLRGGRGLRVRG